MGEHRKRPTDDQNGALTPSRHFGYRVQATVIEAEADYFPRNCGPARRERELTADWTRAALVYLAEVISRLGEHRLELIP